MQQQLEVVKGSQDEGRQRGFDEVWDDVSIKVKSRNIKQCSGGFS